MKLHVLKIVILVIFLVIPQIEGTNSFYIDTESTNSTMAAGVWEVEDLEVEAGSVVINEIMWMGSEGDSNDEWIELRNMTDHEIDLSNWQLTKWVSGTHEELMLTIPSGKTIAAHGYFLISNFGKVDSAISIDPDIIDTDVVLVNSDLQIKLYRGDWTNSANLIDTADDGNGNPLAGVNSTLKQSMERNNDPSSGWHTCDDAACNDTTYWDTGGSNYGTPKAANLSDNDPSITLAFPLILQDSQNEDDPLEQLLTIETEPKIEYFTMSEDRTTVSFALTNIGGYATMQYVITYSSYGIVRGIGPSEVMLTGQDTYSSIPFDLATCSDGICTYDTDIEKITIQVTLTKNGEEKVLRQEIQYQ